MNEQQELNIEVESAAIESVEKYKFEPIKGYPMLNWKGKVPFRSTQYYPAQIKEKHGDAIDGWLNQIYWGDNLQVMSHLLKNYRGKVKLIYVDPPFDSKAEYKKKISVKAGKTTNDQTAFEEKQYSDIWTNDDYLQFMYQRLILMRELLSTDGSIYVHCDWHKNHHLRCILDEVFGADNFRNEIVWSYFGFKRSTTRKFPQKHDTIFSYTKSSDYVWDVQYRPHGAEYIKRFKKDAASGRLYRDDVNPTAGGARVIYLDQVKGDIIDSVWDDIPPVNPVAKEREGYPTQKPEALIERIVKSSSQPGDIVFDCFMGSGTTQAVSMKLGRKFIGADINLGAVQTSTKRLIKLSENIIKNSKDYSDTDEVGIEKFYTGFSVYNVNHYDVFRNPVQAHELLMEALEVQPLEKSSIYDGEKDGRMVKIMPVNRIATPADLNELITGFDYKTFEKRKEEKPNQPVEKLYLICMGHVANLAASLQSEVDYKLDIEVVDILRHKSKLEFKRESEVSISINDGKLKIEQYYPMNLLQKLSLLQENVEDWRELVESVMIDWNYDGGVFEPLLVDIPDKNVLVEGEYDIPQDAGTIRIKVTDLLSESLEVNVQND